MHGEEAVTNSIRERLHGTREALISKGSRDYGSSPNSNEQGPFLRGNVPGIMGKERKESSEWYRK